MTRPIAYGIDFGTTNSSVAIAYQDRVEMVDVSREGMPSLLPSIIYLHRNRNRAAGEQAIAQYLVAGSRKTRCGGCEFSPGHELDPPCRQYRAGSFCQDARIISELKFFLADPTFKRTHSWGVDFEMEDLAAIVLSDLKRAADRACGHNVEKAVLGFPVMFAGAEGPHYLQLQQLAVDRLMEAANRAGFAEVELLEEPAAAAAGEVELEGVVLVVDFGGGTFDVAVVELGDEQGDVLALQGAAIGGERFTERLFEAKVEPWLDLGRVPNWFRRDLRSLGGVMSMLTNAEVPGIIEEGREASPGLGVIDQVLYGGHAHGFYKAIDNAKIDLSSQTKTEIRFQRPGIDINIPVQRSEFDRLIRDDLDVTEEQIGKALEQAHIGEDDVIAVLRTGGSSSIPSFAHRLESMFGAEKIHEREVFTTIVCGLAAHARQAWG